jgi:hypothetical protein
VQRANLLEQLRDLNQRSLAAHLGPPPYAIDAAMSPFAQFD